MTPTPTKDSDPGLRLAVHPAHRAAGARGEGLLRGGALEPPPREDQGIRPHGHHPLGRAAVGLRRGRTPARPRALLEMGVPVLGICYGMQWMAWALGAEVARSDRREYGPALFTGAESCVLFKGMPGSQPIWMSHGDRVEGLPDGLRHRGVHAQRPGGRLRGPAAQALCAIQFHPEVTHTRPGTRSPAAVPLRASAASAGDWTMASFVESAAEAHPRPGRLASACSAPSRAAWTPPSWRSSSTSAIGDKLDLLFIDHGLLRKDESRLVQEAFADKFHLKLRAVDASARFFAALKGLSDPEDKRKAVGRTFIEVFEEEARQLGDIRFLAQGTIYPDRIESAATSGAAQVIKSHHNVGGLPERMQHEGGGAPARPLQGRGARRGPPPGPGRGLRQAPALPGPGPRRAHPGRGACPRTWPSSRRRTPSSSRRSAPRGSTTPSPRPSPCSCPCAPWGSWATSAPTNGWWPSGPSPPRTS